MTNDLISTPSGHEIWASLIEGGPLNVLLGKEASKAISRLVAGAVDIPAAALRNIAQRIEDDTNARSTITKAVANSVASAAKKHPDVLDRGLERWTNVQRRKQENVEAVAREAVEDLKLTPPGDSAREPASDFMARFERGAEDASSAEMRALFSRILAGEIRQPGSFSLQALQILSVMDQRLAEAIRQVRSWTPEIGLIPTRAPFIAGEPLTSISLLADFGLVRIGQHLRPITPGSNGEFAWIFGSKMLYFSAPKVAGRGARRVEVFLVSPVGMEIFSLVDYPSGTEHLRAPALAWSEALGTAHTHVGDVDHVETVEDGRVAINHGPLTSFDVISEPSD